MIALKAAVHEQPMSDGLCHSSCDDTSYPWLPFLRLGGGVATNQARQAGATLAGQTPHRRIS